jgi:hypothetical protein
LNLKTATVAVIETLPGGGSIWVDSICVFRWVPQIGGGGEVPSIEGMERGF